MTASDAFALLDRFLSSALTIDLFDERAIEQALGVSLGADQADPHDQELYKVGGTGAVSLIRFYSHRHVWRAAPRLEIELLNRPIGLWEVEPMLRHLVGDLSQPRHHNPFFCDFIPCDPGFSFDCMPEERQPHEGADPIGVEIFKNGDREISLVRAMWYGPDISPDHHKQTWLHSVALGLVRPEKATDLASPPDEYEFEKDGPWNPQPRPLPDEYEFEKDGHWAPRPRPPGGSDGT